MSNIDKKLDLIDRAVYEKALEKRLIEVLVQEPNDTNEPEFSDFKPEGPGLNTVAKIGPGKASDRGGGTEGTYAIMVQKRIGRKGTWNRQYRQSRGESGAAKRDILHTSLAQIAQREFHKVLISPMQFGPHQPMETQWRDRIQSSRGSEYVDQLFIARANPKPDANIINLDPNRSTGSEIQVGHNRFRCYPEESSRSNVLEENHPPETEDLDDLWAAFKAQCNAVDGGGWSKWWVYEPEHEDAGSSGWWLKESEGDGQSAPRVDDEEEDSSWAAQVGKVVWGWRRQWHYRIIEVPSEEQLGDVKMRVVDFVWPGKPTRKEEDDYTFYLKDISTNHRLTQHVRAQLEGNDQYEIKDAPAPPAGLNELKNMIKEMLGGGPKFNTNKRTSWEGWTHEADEPDANDIDEQNDEDGDPPSNLIGKEVGDDSRSAAGGATRLVPETDLRAMIREIQQMTMNPFAGEERLPPQDISRPVIQGRVSGPRNSSDAIALFETENNIDSGSHNITCEKAAGQNSWTCIANKSDMSGDKGVSLPSQEDQALD